jgi:hypothetical protein
MPEVPTISRERALHGPGHHHQAATVSPAQVTVDPDPEGDGAEVVVTHQGGAPHSGVHPPDGLALLALDLSRVDGLAPPGQVERGSQ